MLILTWYTETRRRTCDFNFALSSEYQLWAAVTVKDRDKPINDDNSGIFL